MGGGWDGPENLTTLLRDKFQSLSSGVNPPPTKYLNSSHSTICTVLHCSASPPPQGITIFLFASPPYNAFLYHSRSPAPILLMD